MFTSGFRDAPAMRTCATRKHVSPRKHIAAFFGLLIAISSTSSLARGNAGEGSATQAKSNESAGENTSLLSRKLPVYASSGSANRASDENYNDLWRSSGPNATITYDLSKVPNSARQRLLVVWYNDYTYAYDHAIFKWPGYNNPGTYTVEVNAAPGGMAPPTEGWAVADSISKNTLHSREHLLLFSGNNWIRLHFTESDGSSQNMDIAAKIDIYNADVALTSAWFFAGDSITANGMGHLKLSSKPGGSFSAKVFESTGNFPVQENAGMPFWTAASAIPYLPKWLDGYPGRYVTLNFGTNDASGVPPGDFYNNMRILVKIVLSAGKVPVIPTIPWARRKDLLIAIPLLNGQIHRLISEEPCVLAGPDLYGYFSANKSLISEDNVHPTDDGLEALRRLWAATASGIMANPRSCSHPLS